MTKTYEHYREEGNDDEYKRNRQEEDQYHEEMLNELEQIEKMEYDLTHESKEDLIGRTLRDDKGLPKNEPTNLNI